MTGRTKSNILILHLDQLRADCLGPYGNDEVYTPNIDRLASDGVVFSHHYCPYPVCTPSRYSFISGQYVHEHRAGTNHSTMLPGTPTFPAILRDSGYRTACVGKMHYTPTYCEVGFQTMVLAEQNGPGRYDDDYHRWLRDRELVDYNDLEDQEREYRVNARDEYWKTFGSMPSNLPEEAHSTTWIANRAMEQLEGWGENGHLLMVGFIKPHHPFDPPQRWMDYYDADRLTVLPGWLDKPLDRDLDFNAGYFDHRKLDQDAVRLATAGYYATISHIDEQIGRMLDLLVERGLYDDTLIVLTSDHGEFMGFHHMLLKSNHMYEPLARIPLVMKYPVAERVNTIDDRLTNNLDLAPTILKLCGQNVPGTMSGLDLCDTTAKRDIMLAEGNRPIGCELMARNDRFKLLYNMLNPADSLMFDLETDPYELVNLWGSAGYDDVQQKLVSAIAAWFPEEQYEAYLDEDAPIATGDNVPERGDGHRQALYAYYEAMMTARER